MPKEKLKRRENSGKTHRKQDCRVDTWKNNFLSETSFEESTTRNEPIDEPCRISLDPNIETFEGLILPETLITNFFKEVKDVLITEISDEENIKESFPKTVESGRVVPWFWSVI
eukprot:CAMPEP_0194291522 /NCGR_PEP_ID=MMETSP0169-20130528/43551_1 /TAXON_ID=218684 /ORGANISM="Corethron pennatum, Strain L29A3" /LENGTH=113 /DNA_ID=CAMNT_0039039427 /DNA_START=550 /DNA_END=888 /DNA_ORIENTATION=-